MVKILDVSHHISSIHDYLVLLGLFLDGFNKSLNSDKKIVNNMVCNTVLVAEIKSHVLVIVTSLV